MNRRRMILEQMTEKTLQFSKLKEVSPPVKGWIRAIRDALGMSAVQFAKRQKVSPARVASLEKAELTGAVTIRSMRKAAEALDCVFVYALVPRSSLESIIREQARKVAQARLERTSHTMLLEDQRPAIEDLRRVLDATVAELMAATPRNLWDEP
jgi:predicted DNA-binding mobile mystery protein A